eukprot:GHVL01012230.1.p1 GENE.GHVL01012230.1~~GHVL01012230.1.p1  ORF type:complete len:135 (+),score=5.66 GHVL01012230.1:94-498(+)
MEDDAISETQDLVGILQADASNFSQKCNTGSATTQDIDALMSQLKRRSNQAFDNIGEKLKKRLHEPGFQKYARKISDILNGIMGLFSNVVQKIHAFLNEVFNAVVRFASAAVTSVSSFFSGLASGLYAGIRRLF